MTDQPFHGRREDDGFLRGTTDFVADLTPADVGVDEFLHVTFARSAIAHGDIRSIDSTAAVQAPGVLAVYTAATIGLERFVHVGAFDHSREQSRRPLADDRVRHVGEAVAMVVAASVPLAVDASEGVDIDIEILEPVLDPRRSDRGPLLYPEAGTNLVHALGTSDGSSTGAPSSAATASGTSVTLAVANPKVSSATMECDGIIAIPTAEGGLDIWCTSQGVQAIRQELSVALDLPTSALRLRSPAVGGGFGGRATLPIEFVAVAKAALLLGRPLRWIQTRTEQLTCQPHGRGLYTTITLDADDAGRLRSLEAEVVADAGSTAHIQGGLLVSALRQLPGLYTFDSITTGASAWLTNTTPVGAYRGAGQPEANHARERAIDVLARRLGRDPIEFRLENLVADGAGPSQPHGLDYDDVAPRAALLRAVELADLPRWRSVQSALLAADAPTRLGIGVSCYAQTSGRGEPEDSTELRLLADGTVEVFAASPAHGQGHEHTFSQLIADRLGIDPDLVRYVDADTAHIESGLSTGGSRTTQVLGHILDAACEQIVDDARPLVAEQLEVAATDLVVAPAGFGRGPGLAVAGVPTRRVEWAELAHEAPNGCLATAQHGPALGASHPFGAHLSIVEVEIDTGRCIHRQHVGVDDAGNVLQPALLEGQQHGGCVAGLGQAMGEAIRHDDLGNPITSNLGTYLVPTIDSIGSLEVSTTQTPTDRNSLGTRGIGENGCNGATAAFHNAVMDALGEWGIEHLDLPLDPETIFRAISESTTSRG